MDILAIPDNPSFPVPRTRFVAEQWDCGNFLLYATRKGLLHRVPVGSRRPDPAAHIPYLEPVSPTPKAENETFYQTWFYVGLIAECLGLNEGPLQEPSPSPTSVPERLDAVIEQVTFEDDGQSFISGAKVFEILTPFLGDLSSLRALLRGDPADRAGMLNRARHLHACLNLAWKMLHNSIMSDFDPTIKWSIAAVAELITIAAHHATSNMQFKELVAGESAGVFAFGGCSAYLNPGSEVEAAMLRCGWCPSDIERLRRTYNGLGTLHYVSRLDRSKGRRHSHASCDKAFCRAFQIDLETYTLAHTTPNCTCSEYGVRSADVQHILRETGSFPVLRFNCVSDGKVELVVEKYEEGMEYVALSHVWADGLGNPSRNAIQQCQVVYLMGIISDLEASIRAQGGGLPAQTQPYRLWIDTLCCPVELSGKLIALGRIKDVYAQASHVLVLDSYVSSFPYKGKPAAEPALRAVGTSPWMRRLWTLQEAVLAKSLCFRFSDGTVREIDVMKQLFLEAKQDVRWLQLFTDAANEFMQLHKFKQRHGVLPFANVHELLFALQTAIHFRTVTVPSDEPLCLSTLASLDITNIALHYGSEERMACFWQELAERYGGVPARVIFLEDNNLVAEGFRWAPRSLLNADARSWHGLPAKQVRFAAARSGAGASLGVPTPQGLRVRFPGCRIEARPLTPGLGLHPWHGILNEPLEDRVYLRHQQTNRWLCVHDWERTQVTGVLTQDEMAEWSRKANNPICRAIDAGNAALIHDISASTPSIAAAHDMHPSLLVSVRDGSITETESNSRDLHVRRNRILLFYPISDAEAFMVDSLRALAGIIAAEDVTRSLGSIDDRDSPEYKAALEKVRDRMKAVMLEFWEATPAFESAVLEVFGPDMKEYIWATIPKFCSHDVFIADLPADQVWVVD